MVAARKKKRKKRVKRTARPLVGGCVPLTLMVLAWSWGEWLGYVTETRPRDLTVAAEREED